MVKHMEPLTIKRRGKGILICQVASNTLIPICLNIQTRILTQINDLPSFISGQIGFVLYVADLERTNLNQIIEQDCLCISTLFEMQEISTFDLM